MEFQGKIKIKHTRNRKFYFIIVAENGQTLLTSQAYTSKTGVRNGIRSSLECFLQKDLIIEDLTRHKKKTFTL